MDILGIIGILISLVIAWWEHHKAKRAERLFNETLNKLPGQLVNDIARLINRNPQANSVVTESPNNQSSLAAQYVDLNGDGKEEMIVSYLSGPHSFAIQVYGPRGHWDFGLLGEIKGSTPHEYDLEDVDGDGLPEITCIEVSRDAGLPYIMGFFDRVSYKLTKDGLTEVKRNKCYSEDDLREATSKH